MIVKNKIPIYGGSILFVVAESIEGGAKEMQTELESGYESCDAITLKKDHANYAIIIEAQSINRPDIIAHESKHLVNYVFEDRGIGLDVSNDEAECYFLGWVVGQFHKAIEQYKKAQCKT